MSSWKPPTLRIQCKDKPIICSNFREFCHVLTRRIKILFIITRITFALMVMMIYFGVAKFDFDAPYDYSVVDIDEVVEAVHAAFLINLCVVFPLMYVYR